MLLVALHHVEDERREHVEALTVAHGLVVARECQQHALQQDPVLLVGLSIERVRRVAGSVQVLNYKYNVYWFEFMVAINTLTIVTESL